MSYIGNTPGDKFLTLEKQVFTTSATDTYSLDREVSSVNDIELFLNNVRQEPTEAYTISGTTLTLASAITASDSMYCVYQGRAVGTQSPAVGSVTNDMLAGSIANAKLANSSITLNGTAVSLGGSATTATTNGITSAEHWRLTTSFTGNANPLTNLERADNTKSGSVGTSITVSSGVFTLPTGIWKIEFVPLIYGAAGNDTQVNCEINVDETNSGTFSGYATGLINLVSGSWTTGYISIMLDVTDSNVKVRFAIVGNSGEVGGSSAATFTHMNFIRLGDT